MIDPYRQITRREYIRERQMEIYPALMRERKIAVKKKKRRKGKRPARSRATENVLARLNASHEEVVGALMWMYSNQTASEQQAGGTVEDNGIGFNGVDGGILSSFAKQYEAKEWLSDKQCQLARTKLYKYSKQLVTAGKGWTPLNIIDEKPNLVPPGFIGLVEDHSDTLFRISFPTPPGEQVLRDTVRTLWGKFEPNKNYWLIQKQALKIIALREMYGEHKFFESPETAEEFNELTKEYKMAMEGCEYEAVGDIPGMKVKLFPYQAEGVGFIDSRNGKALVADEMGLGKTIEALGYLQLRPEALPALVICPASLKLNWAKEVEKFTSLSCQVVGGKTPHLVTADVVIANYDILAPRVQKVKHFQWEEYLGEGEWEQYATEIPEKMLGRTRDGHAFAYHPAMDSLAEKKKEDKSWAAKLKMVTHRAEIAGTGWSSAFVEQGFQSVVMDECHYVKNRKAGRTKNTEMIAASSPRVICLSGTPIINRPVELYTAINMVNRTLFPNFMDYAQRYCKAEQTGRGWSFKGATNTDELHEILTRSIMIRRLKADVLKDLPLKRRSVVPIELDNRTAYDFATKNFIQWMTSEFGEKAAIKARRAEVLVKINKLKKLAAMGKMKTALAWIRNFVEQDQKLVVFGNHREILDAVAEAFHPDEYVQFDGRVNQADRQAAVEKFQTDPGCRLFIGNIKAAGCGITLTEASNTCFLELGWTPGEHDQAEDRVHRIGQEAESVGAYYLVSSGTIEDDLVQLLDEKRTVVKSVLDGVDVDEGEMLTALLDRLGLDL